MAFRNAEFSENSLYRKLKKKTCQKKWKERKCIFCCCCHYNLSIFIISATTYFFMSFVIKIIIKLLISVVLCFSRRFRFKSLHSFKSLVSNV